MINKKTEHLYKVSTPCLDDHNFKKEELETVGEMSQVCSQIVLKCLYLARIGRPDILWSENQLARAVSRWTRACDRRSARLVSFVHHTNDYLYGHPLAGLLWERLGKVLLGLGWEKVSNWSCLFVHRKKGLFLTVYVDDIKMAAKKQNMAPMWKKLMKNVDFDEPTSFLDHKNST